MATHSSVLAWKVPVDRGGAWRAAVRGVPKESDTTVTLTVVSHDDLDLPASDLGCDNSSLMELPFFFGNKFNKDFIYWCP